MLKIRHSLSLLPAAAALFCCSLARADNIADSALIFLAPDAGSMFSSVLAGPVTYAHGVDGVVYGSDRHSAMVEGVHLSFQNDVYWDFRFLAPTYDPVTNSNNGQALQVGHYDSVRSLWSSSPTKAAMQVAASGAWGTQTSGWFNVLDISYSPNGDLASLALDFRQYDNANLTGPSLFGSLRYNSDVAITPVPEPVTYGMLLAGLGLVATLARRRKESAAA
jgi:hypothetical protein